MEDLEVGERSEALLGLKRVPKQRVVCGGFLGTPCPGVGECVDDSADDCDPANGGSDCSGVCACTQATTCPNGTTFDNSPAVCDCRPRRPGTIGDNPCAITLCRAGTRCEVINGEATCVPNGGLAY